MSRPASLNSRRTPTGRGPRSTLRWPSPSRPAAIRSSRRRCAREGRPSSPMIARFRAYGEGRPDRDRHRTEYGGQINLSEAKCADRGAGADGCLRAGAARPYWRRRPVVFPRRRGRRSCARALDLHGRNGRNRRDPQSAREKSLVILDEIGRGTATFEAFPSPGR